MGRSTSQLSKEHFPAHSGEAQVENKKIRNPASNGLEGVQAVLRDRDLKSGSKQDLLPHKAKRRVVFHDENEWVFSQRVPVWPWASARRLGQPIITCPHS